MRKVITLLIVLAVAVTLTSIGSRFVARSLAIRTGGIDQRILGIVNGKPHAFAEGSSLMVEGLDWNRISSEIGTGVQNWFVAGSSPSEWEPLQKYAPDANLSIFVVSAYDLNEYFVCDYRSEIVPIGQTIADLQRSGAEWHFSKRLLSQYPLKYVRDLFPTVGRSDGVMVGARERLRQWIQPWYSMEAEAGPAVSVAAAVTPGVANSSRVSDWSTARRLRRLALMRSACQGKQSYDGPKKLAFDRLLHRASTQGRVLVIVLPVSPFYIGEFLSATVASAFEKCIEDAQTSVPSARWIRIDQLPGLASNECYWDLVHLNADGRQIATNALLPYLRPALLSSAP